MSGGRVVKLFCLVTCSFAALWLLVGEAEAQPGIAGKRVVERVTKGDAVLEDFVRFTNGDLLTGDIAEIVDGVVAMKPLVAERELRIPIGALKEAVFREGEEEASFAGDQVLLVNGESLTARIEEMTEGTIILLLPSGRRIKLDANNVSSVSFHKGEEILAEENFDSGLPEKMRFGGSRWRTQRGWLIQSDSRATECFGSLPLTQRGDLMYEWTANTTTGGSTGIYFMASDPELWQTRAYFVRVLRKYVYVYYCMNGEEVYCGSYKVSLYKSKNEVRLRCNADDGLIELQIDGEEVGRWKSANPIKTGKYVILRADGRGVFDNLRVVRREGAPKPEPPGEKEDSDVLTLVNGDRILAKVTGITEKSVSFTGHGNGSGKEIERERLLSVGFKRELKSLPRGMGGTVVLVTHRDERISGKLLSVDEQVARMASDIAGEVEIRRKDMKKIIFREFP